jgi:hypothetical protein
LSPATKGEKRRGDVDASAAMVGVTLGVRWLRGKAPANDNEAADEQETNQGPPGLWKQAQTSFRGFPDHSDEPG